MKIKSSLLTGLLWLALFLARPISLQAQFNFTTNDDGTLNLSSYTGPGGTVVIPATTNGLTVSTIGTWAFANDTTLTSVYIPASITSLTNLAFLGCSNLANITVDPQNQFYRSVNGVMYDKAQAQLVLFPAAQSGSYTIPDSVTTIQGHAFAYCTNLASLIVPASVTNIEANAFYACHNPFNAYFKGPAPAIGSYAVISPNVTFYYLPGMSGWPIPAPIFDVSLAPWYLPQPLILDDGPGLGLQTNEFNFIISWATNASVEVLACTNLSKPAWLLLQTGVLNNGTYYFSDSPKKLLPSRFYRVSAVPY